MIPHGAASLPRSGGRHEQEQLPGPGELRAALRPPQLPLPAPTGVLEAADRIDDLIHAEQFREARTLFRSFLGVEAAAVERIALLRAGLAGAGLAGDREAVDRSATDLIAQLRAAGHPAQAEATAIVLAEGDRPGSQGRSVSAGSSPSVREDPSTPSSPEAPSAPLAPFAPSAPEAPSSLEAPRRGRRRGVRAEVSAELLAVVRGLESSARPGGTQPDESDPHHEVRRLAAALEALPVVGEQILGDPEPLLRLRFAQALEAAGDSSSATTAALDVLEMLEQRQLDRSGPAQPAAQTEPEQTEPEQTEPAQAQSAQPAPCPTPERMAVYVAPERVAAAAHAVLSRALGVTYPLQAIRHALDALGTLHQVDDPPLRIGLITDLLQALMHAGATSQASFTAERLISLQRTLPRDGLRIAPLLAVAAQRMHAERYEAAMAPLEQARAIAREQRDRYASLEAARLAASIHDRSGDLRASLPELQQIAADARWLADDLATGTAQRPALVRTELEARAMVMRRALDLAETAVARSAAQLIDRRARSEEGTPLLPPELLWDHRVDARAGLFIAVGAALGRGEEGVSRHECEQRRREAMLAVDEAPAGHDARARYWAAYLDDRHAQMLAVAGRDGRALRAARRAREGWEHLGSTEDIARLDRLIAELETPSAP